MKKIFYLILSFIFTISVKGQDFTNKKIVSILIIGNNTTKEDVIRREMLLNVGDIYNDSLRVLSEKRITNLFLFNDVQIIPVPDNQDLALLVRVTERLFIFPFPELRIEDRDWKKLTYGLGIAHINFRGRNEKLYGMILFGYRPGFQIDYYNPWIGGNDHYTNKISLMKFSTAHKVLDLNENHFLVHWTIGKYWNRYFYNLISFEYENVRIPRNDFINNEAGLPVPENKYEDNITGVDFSVNYDSRDLIVYPTQGWYSRLLLSKEGLFNPAIDYYQYILDIRHYKSAGPFVIAARAYTMQTLGDLPISRYVYLGFDERVRGHFSEVRTGQHVFLASFETRVQLIPLHKYNFPSLFLPESSTQNLKFGLNAALFFDTGTVWGKDITNPQQTELERKLENQKFINGFGISLGILLPYVEIARLEYAFNEKFKPEVIFEIGVSF